MNDTDMKTKPTVAELEAELRKAKEREQEERQQREREIAIAKHQEELMLTDGYIAELQKALAERGIESTVRAGKIGQYGSPSFATLDFPEDSPAFKASANPRVERRGVAFSSTGSYQIQFGGYGERKTYPRLKDGTFNYSKIADEMVALIGHSSTRRNRLERESANYALSNKLAEQLESEFKSVRATISGTGGDAARVKVKIEDLFTPEEARQLLAARALLDKVNK